MAFYGKYYETKLQVQKMVRRLRPKLWKAARVLCDIYLLGALVLAKHASKASRLFRFSGYF
jgi:hypothetical protein